MTNKTVKELVEEVRSYRFKLECANQLCNRYKTILTYQESEIEALREALGEARLIVANVPGDESLFLAKIDTALTGGGPTDGR